MTWTKLGAEFPDDCAEAALSDAAFRTHLEAIAYCYRAEKTDLVIQRRLMGRWATSEHHAEAVRELVARGFWEAIGEDWRILHHGDVVRQSLAYQVNERERSKNAMRKKREREAGPEVTPDVTRNAPPNVTRDVMRTQPVSQSVSQKKQLEANEIDDPWHLCIRCGEPVDDDAWAQGQRVHQKCTSTNRKEQL